MITVEDAIRRLEKKYPNQRIVSGLDMGDFYAFSMMKRAAHPTNMVNIPINPVMKGIRKNSGEEFLFLIFHSSQGDLKGEIEVTKYLSADDAAFSRKIKAILEG